MTLQCVCLLCRRRLLYPGRCLQQMETGTVQLQALLSAPLRSLQPLQKSGFTFGSANASTAPTLALSFASPLGGSSTTVSSFSAASPAVFQQGGSFSFGSSSIAAHSTAPGFSFGLSPSSVGSAAATAPSGFGVGGTAMRSFGVSTPRPFAFEGSAPNNAATSFPAVFSAAATTVQSISFSFGSNTSPVSRFDTPSQTTTPSFPSSSLGLGGRSLWTPRRTSKPVRRY